MNQYEKYAKRLIVILCLLIPAFVIMVLFVILRWIIIDIPSELYYSMKASFEIYREHISRFLTQKDLW